MTKFIDANIFIERWSNPAAKELIDDLQRNEHSTSVLVLAETFHQLQKKKVENAFEYLRGIMGSITVFDIAQEDFFNAIKSKSTLHINDQLHVELMKRNGIKNIISYDKDFDRSKTVEREEP